MKYTLDTYTQDLHRLSKDCTFQAVTAEQHRQGYVRDAFISGIQSKDIRQKLLENVSLTMEQILEQARTLQWLTKMTSHTQRIPSHCVQRTANIQLSVKSPMQTKILITPLQLQCILIQIRVVSSVDTHGILEIYALRRTVSANYVAGLVTGNSKCKLCGRTGHWGRVCKSSNKTSNSSNNQYRQQNHQQQRYQHGTSAAIWPSLAAIPQGGGGTTAYCKIKIKKSKINALIDTGSTSCSFIHKHLVTRLKLPIIPAVGEVSMANASSTTKVEGECIVDIQLRKRKYEKVKLYILDNVCAEVILGQDFMEQHKSVVFNFGGSKPSLIVSALTAMNV